MDLALVIDPYLVRVGRWLSVSFQRTLRVADRDDGKPSPLPPGLGGFPVVDIDDVRDHLPEPWRGRRGLLLPMYRREALWLGFHAPAWHPCAVKVGVGRVNALTGGPWDEALHVDPQDYLVCPYQPWLDGFKTAAGVVRQFVAVPLGLGDTVEGQITGEESLDALTLLVYEPKPGRFPDEAPPGPEASVTAASAPAMGLGAGGTIEQKLYPDPHGLDTWDLGRKGVVSVSIIDSGHFKAVTGRDPPPTPVTPETYARYGLPWFALFDADRADLPTSTTLSGVRSVRERTRDRGDAPDPDDRPPGIPPPIVTIRPTDAFPTEPPDGS